MIYTNPAYKKEQPHGYEEGYRLKDVKSLTVTFETVVGGRMDISASKEDRLMIVDRGMGFANMRNQNKRVEKGTVVEIPAGVDVEISCAQLKFYLVSSVSN